jgi:hypothetical protein
MEDGEEIDQTGDFEDDIEMDDDEVEDDEVDMDDDEVEGDVEDRVGDLEAELEDLRAEFEALMADEMDEPEHADMFGGEEEGDMDMGDEDGFEDEEEFDVEDDMEMEGLEEATTFSQKTSEQPMKGGKLKGSEDDASNGKSAVVAGGSTVKHGEPVKSHDGGEGKKNHGGTVKSEPTNHNMNVKTSSKGSGYGAGMKKPDMGDKNGPFTKTP